MENSVIKQRYKFGLVTGACFDWFPVSCEPHEKKKKEMKKDS